MIDRRTDEQTDGPEQPQTRVEFSIIIPLYNKRDYIKQTIESVLDQSVSSFEIIIIDDGSSDDGVDVIRTHFTDPRIRLFSQNNKGASAARNYGISLACGTIVCFLDADDIWLPNKLAITRDLFHHYPDAQFASTSYFKFLNQTSPPPQLVASKKFKINTSADPNQINHELVNDFYIRWLKDPFVNASSIAVRRDLLIHHELKFPIGEQQGEDLDFWFQLCELSPMAFSKAKVVGYRRGLSDSLSGAFSNDVLPVFVRLRDRIYKSEIKAPLLQSAKLLLRDHEQNLTLSFARRGLRLHALKRLRLSDCTHLRFLLIFIIELSSPRIGIFLRKVLRRI